MFKAGPDPSAAAQESSPGMPLPQEPADSPRGPGGGRSQGTGGATEWQLGHRRGMQACPRALPGAVAGVAGLGRFRERGVEVLGGGAQDRTSPRTRPSTLPWYALTGAEDEAGPVSPGPWNLAESGCTGLPWTGRSQSQGGREVRVGDHFRPPPTLSGCTPGTPPPPHGSSHVPTGQTGGGTCVS